jgi:UDP:flavonoid glycosyltransferase YjiC (YdhE family)
VSAASLRAAVHRLLAEPAFRDRAAEIGRSFMAAGGATRGAGAILDFVRADRR